MINARIQTATIAGFLLASPLLLAALAADAARSERHLQPARELAGQAAPPASDLTPSCAPDCGMPDPFSDESSWRGWRADARSSVRYALDLVRGLAVPMVVAVGIAAAIVDFVPQDLVARWGWSRQPLRRAGGRPVGRPFYVSTAAFLPIASALHTNGMALGAVFALVISAAGVNIPELALLGRLMSPRLLVAYILTIVGVAVVVGYLVPVVAQ